MEKLTAFLQDNPWVVLATALVTFWPALKRVMKGLNDASFWLAKDTAHNVDDVIMSVTWPSYFFAQLVNNIVISIFYSFIAFILFKSKPEFSTGIELFLQLIVTGAGICCSAAALVALFRSSDLVESVRRETQRRFKLMADPAKPNDAILDAPQK